MEKYLYRNDKNHKEIVKNSKPGLVDRIKLRLKGYKFVASYSFVVTAKEKAAK